MIYIIISLIALMLVAFSLIVEMEGNVVNDYDHDINHDTILQKGE
jgi:hypothetical protein